MDAPPAGAATVPVTSTVDTSRPVPLSFGQERLWFLNRLDPGDASFNMFLVYRLRGPVDLDTLQRALGVVVDRHDVLRTRFVADDGEPAQVVSPPGGLALSRVEVPAGEADPVGWARRQVAAWTNAPFDLAAGPPVRAGTVRLGADDHVLCLVVHHIAGDGRSLALILGSDNG